MLNTSFEKRLQYGHWTSTYSTSVSGAADASAAATKKVACNEWTTTGTPFSACRAASGKTIAAIAAEIETTTQEMLVATE